MPPTDAMSEQTEREACPYCDGLGGHEAGGQVCFDDEDDPDDWMDECGYVPGEGVCMFAGTEHCDWECPFNPCDPEGL